MTTENIKNETTMENTTETTVAEEKVSTTTANEETVQETAEQVKENNMTTETEPSQQEAETTAQRRSRRRSRPIDMDYMQGYVHVESPAEQYREELQHIREVIDNNIRVSRSGRGELQFITAMMTRNDEQRAISGNPNSLTGTHVYAREILPDRESLGILDLEFDGGDFLAYSGMEEGEGSELYRRQRQYSSHAVGSKFLCAPIRIMAPEETGTGLPKVLCSRAFAMEYLQDKFFFGNKPLAHEGGHGIAYVMAGYPTGIRVEFGGIETFIPRGQLTSRQLVVNASSLYKPGTGLDVSIVKLNVDKENRTIEIRLSGVKREVELGLVPSVSTIKIEDKPRHLAEVIVVANDVSVVRIVDLGIIGIIPNSNVLPAGEKLSVRDRVFMEITGVHEESNRVIGSCIKL